MALSFISSAKKVKSSLKKCKHFSEKWSVGSGHSQQATHPCSRRGRGSDDYDDIWNDDDDDDDDVYNDDDEDDNNVYNDDDDDDGYIDDDFQLFFQDFIPKYIYT